MGPVSCPITLNIVGEQQSDDDDVKPITEFALVYAHTMADSNKQQKELHTLYFLHRDAISTGRTINICPMTRSEKLFYISCANITEASRELLFRKLSDDEKLVLECTSSLDIKVIDVMSQLLNYSGTKNCHVADEFKKWFFLDRLKNEHGDKVASVCKRMHAAPIPHFSKWSSASATAGLISATSTSLISTVQQQQLQAANQSAIVSNAYLTSSRLAREIKGKTFINCTFDGIDFSGHDASFARFRNCTFKNCSFTGSVFDGADDFLHCCNGNPFVVFDNVLATYCRESRLHRFFSLNWNLKNIDVVTEFRSAKAITVDFHRHNPCNLSSEQIKNMIENWVNDLGVAAKNQQQCDLNQDGELCRRLRFMLRYVGFSNVQAKNHVNILGIYIRPYSAVQHSSQATVMSSAVNRLR